MYEQSGIAHAAGQAPKLAANFADGDGSWETGAAFPVMGASTRETGSQSADADAWAAPGATYGGADGQTYWNQDFEENSTNTSDGGDAAGYLHVGIDPATTDADLYQVYAAVKQRWRAQVGKAPRRFRKGGKGGRPKGKGRGRSLRKKRAA